jgi:hypothetical protein
MWGGSMELQGWRWKSLAKAALAAVADLRWLI